VTETIASPSQNEPSPRITPGDAQLVAPRRGTRELFPSSWLRTPAEVTHVGGTTEGTLLEFVSTRLIIQSDGSKVLVSWDVIHTVTLKEHGL
jgi:hypothetical protein